MTELSLTSELSTSISSSFVGGIVNKPDAHSGALDWQQICQESSKVLTFIDLAGHEKYLKTTVFGMTGHAPDFCMLMIG